MFEAVILTALGVACMAGAALTLLVVRLRKRVDALSSHVGTLMVWYDKTVYPKKVK